MSKALRVITGVVLFLWLGAICSIISFALLGPAGLFIGLGLVLIGSFVARRFVTFVTDPVAWELLKWRFSLAKKGRVMNVLRSVTEGSPKERRSSMYPDNQSLPVPYNQRQSLVANQQQQTDVEVLSDEEIAVIRNTSLAQLLVDQQVDLGIGGGQALDRYYFETAAMYAQGVGRVIALKNRIQDPELQEACAGFFQDLTDRYGAGLLDNFDKVRAEINRVVARSVRPQERQAVVEEIEVSFMDWLRGKKQIVTRR